MDRLETMRLFVRIVERRSFKLAAQDTGYPRATVTQAIKAMEERLGTRVLQRTTRHVSPTFDGEAYYRRCLSILADVEEAEGAVSGARPKGLLRVEAHGTLARHFVLPRLLEFLDRYPEIRLHISEGDRMVDLVREGIDCALRVGELADSTMIARRLTMLEEVTFASPGYLKRYGVPADPDDLDGHVGVGFVSSSTGAALQLELVQRDVVRAISLPSIVSVTAAESLIAAAKLGLGLAQAPRYHLEDDLASGALVVVLDSYAPRPSPVSLLYPPNRQLSARVRAFVDWVKPLFEGGSAA